MLVTLVACGTAGNNTTNSDNTPSNNSQQGQTSNSNSEQSTNSDEHDNSALENATNESTDLNNASKDNYASVLKEYFGIDAKDIEETSFTLDRVAGSFSPKNDVQYMLTLEYKNSNTEIAKSYGQKIFDLTRSLSTTGTVFGVEVRDNMLFKGSAEYTDYTQFHDTEKENSSWFYCWNGKDIAIVVYARFTVKVQLSYSDN